MLPVVAIDTEMGRFMVTSGSEHASKSDVSTQML